MNILYISNVRIPSEKASGLAIVRQCQAFSDSGHDVTLLAPLRKKTQVSIEMMYGIHPSFLFLQYRSVPLYVLGKFGLILMYLYESLRSFIYFFRNEREFGIVYSRDQYMLFFFIVFGFSQHCYLEMHTKHTDIITRLVARRVKKLVVISTGLKDLYTDLCNRNDILMEPSGVDLEQFQGLPPMQDIRLELGVPSDKLIFSYVGKYKTMGESKGVNEIIKSFAQAYQTERSLFLYLVGIEDEEMNTVRKLCSDEGIPNEAYAVVSLDQSRFARYLMASDVLLMNYPDAEHYAKYMSPTKLFAYLAVGKPIVSSDLPTIREVTGMKGVVYSVPNSIEDYTNKILEAQVKYPILCTEAKQNIDLVKKYTWGNRSRRII